MAIIKTKTFTNVSPLYTPDNAEVCGSPIRVDFPSTALIAGDLILLATIPAGVSIADYRGFMPDIDSGGSAAFAFSLGVANAGLTDLATVLQASLTVGQASGVFRATNADHIALDSTVDRVLAIKVTTAAATYAGIGKVGRVIVDLEG
jgi:hypothetical protein